MQQQHIMLRGACGGQNPEIAIGSVVAATADKDIIIVWYLSAGFVLFVTTL